MPLGRLGGYGAVGVGCAVLVVFGIVAGAGWARTDAARIGVLAFRGTAAMTARWQPLIRYLNAGIPDVRFELIPVTLVSARQHLEANELDFIVTNPGHYVELAGRFRLSALATRERREGGERTGLLRYGTVIFTRADRAELQTLVDLKGRSLAAVSPDAFGGFQMAWAEFREQGIDPVRDLKEIRYLGFPQDAIVTAVLAGTADAGVVRSGLLEALAREGRLDMQQVKVLLGNRLAVYPYRVSSRLYPEWPFAARLGIDKRLGERVAAALLQTQDAGVADRFGLRDLWSAPLSYQGVRALVASYRARGKVESAADAGRGSGWVTILVTLGAGVLGLLVGYLQWGRSPARIATMPPAADPGGEADAQAVLQRQRFGELTRREREVLSLICCGEPTKRIAETLSISPKTVEYHRANLLQKTGAGSTPRMVQLATRLGYDRSEILG